MVPIHVHRSIWALSKQVEAQAKLLATLQREVAKNHGFLVQAQHMIAELKGKLK